MELRHGSRSAAPDRLPVDQHRRAVCALAARYPAMVRSRFVLRYGGDPMVFVRVKAIQAVREFPSGCELLLVGYLYLWESLIDCGKKTNQLV